MGYRSDIDGLRAIAILSVLIFHIDATYLSGGFIGVDIFFVISGFLITGIIKNEIESTGTFSFKNFYVRRIRRLFPALIVVILLTTIFSTLILSPTHLSSFGGSLTSTLLSISNIFFWIEADYFDVSSIYKPLLHTWSLSVEEQFYFIWPFTLLFLLKLNKKWKIISFMVFFILLSLYMNERFDDGSVKFINNYLPSLKEYISDGSSTIFFLLPFRIYEFMIGALLVWIIQYKVKKIFIYDILFLLGLVFIGYSIFYFDDKMLFPSYIALLPTIGTGLLIYSGNTSRLGFILSNKAMIWFGLISYSLYLIHWPVIVFAKYLFNNITIYDNIIIISFSVLLGYLSYRFVEQPFRTKKYYLGKASFKYSSIFLVLILVFGGYHMYTNNGWEWRVSSVVNFENEGDSKNFHKKFYGGEGYTRTGINTNQPSDIVLLGDSHGMHYAEGIYKMIAEPNKYNLYIAAGTSCFALPNFTRTTVGNDWNNICKNGLNKGLDFIKKGNNPIVIISESWLFQLGVAGILDNDGKNIDKKVTIEDIKEGILNLKKIIGKAQLVVIGNVPGSGYNLYDIFSRPRPNLFTNFEPKDYFYSKPSKENIDFNNELKNMAKNTNQFIFLDPYDILCKNDKCKNINENKNLIYSDAYHLSKYGSIEVINGFKEKLLELLNKRGN